MKTLYQKYNQIEKTVAGLVLLLLILTGFTQVILRFVFQAPLAWAEELIIFCSVWAVYIGSSSAANEGKHIMVSMLVDLLPGKLQTVVKIVSQLLWLLCCIGLTITSWDTMRSTFLRGTATVGGGFPYWVAQIAVPVGMALMSVRVVVAIAKTLRGISDTPSAEEAIREEIKDDIGGGMDK